MFKEKLKKKATTKKKSAHTLRIKRKWCGRLKCCLAIDDECILSLVVVVVNFIVMRHS